MMGAIGCAEAGSSPLTRGALVSGVETAVESGLIPADAGSTSRRS